MGDVPSPPGPVGAASPAGDPRHSLPQRLQRERSVQQGGLPLCCRQGWRWLWGVRGRGNFCLATFSIRTSFKVCDHTGPKSGKPGEPWTLWCPCSPLQVTKTQRKDYSEKDGWIWPKVFFKSSFKLLSSGVSMYRETTLPTTRSWFEQRIWNLNVWFDPPLAGLPFRDLQDPGGGEQTAGTGRGLLQASSVCLLPAGQQRKEGRIRKICVAGDL